MDHGTESNGIKDPNTAEKLLQESTDRQTSEKPRFWFSKRFLVVIMLFFGNLNTVLLKVNLNIAIVEMTSNKSIVTGNITTYEPEFDWDSKTVGLIQSSYAYGYLFCAVGAPIIDKLGGAVTYGMAVLAMAITNIFIPIFLQTNFILFLGSRVFIGLLDGISYMGVLELLSRWAPVRERSFMMALSFCGIYIGVAISYPICGFVAHRLNWQTVFYICGIEGIFMSIIWLILVRNRPSKDKWISKKELMYISENTETIPRKQVVHPYKKIFSSPQVWALCVGKFTYSWGFTLLVVCFPLYVKDMTGRGTDEVGMIASIPNFVCIFTVPMAGFIMDFWQSNSNLKVTQIHKIVMVTGFLSGSVLFLIASFSTSFTLSMTCFILIKFIISFNFLILQLVCLYMSPTHSSILAGASAFWFTVSVILIPTTVGFIVQTHSLQEWSACFLLSAGVLFAGAIIFLIYGSSELQPWSMTLPSKNDEKFNMKYASIYSTIFEICVSENLVHFEEPTETVSVVKKIKNMYKSNDIDHQNANEELLQEQDTRFANKTTAEKTPFWFSKRFLVVFLIFFGNINVVLLINNLNIAIVEMTSKKNITVGKSSTLHSEFDWNSKTIGIVQGMYAYGYFMCIANGYVATKLGGAITFGGSVLLMGILNLLTPACLQLNFFFFLGSRVILGVLDQFAYAGIMEVLSRWASIQERSTMTSLSFSGLYIGTAVVYPIFGLIAHNLGWQWVFYAAGIVGVSWSIIWLLLVKNEPSKDTLISSKERAYILENAETTPRKQIRHPYKKIFTSPQVWALCICKFSISWGLTLLLVSFPLYIKDMTGRGTDEVGLISSIPNFVCIFMIPLAGAIMDLWENNSNLTRTQIYKTVMCIGFFLSALSIVIATYSTNFNLSMACFIPTKVLISFNYLISQLVCLAMSPKHSSVLAGLSSFSYALSAIVIPNIVVHIVQNHSMAEWNICFLLSAGVLFFGAIIFLIFGSSELQPWSKSAISDVDEKFDIENKQS